MPQYLMSVWFDDDYSSEFDRTDPDVVRTSAKVDALNEEMSERNIWLFVGGLQPASTASVVRSDGRRVFMTDGPYAEMCRLQRLEEELAAS